MKKEIYEKVIRDVNEIKEDEKKVKYLDRVIFEHQNDSDLNGYLEEVIDQRNKINNKKNRMG